MRRATEVLTSILVVLVTLAVLLGTVVAMSVAWHLGAILAAML